MFVSDIKKDKSVISTALHWSCYCWEDEKDTAATTDTSEVFFISQPASYVYFSWRRYGSTYVIVLAALAPTEQLELILNYSSSFKSSVITLLRCYTYKLTLYDPFAPTYYVVAITKEKKSSCRNFVGWRRRL